MKSQLCRVLCLALVCTMLPSDSVSQEQGNPKEAKEVLNTYVSVVSKIYPPAGGVFAAMLSALEFTGYFGNSVDPVAAAISAINSRLDEHGRQINKLSTELQDLRQGYLGERNWTRFSKLQASRNNLKTIAEKLADKPADNNAKIDLAGDGRTEAALFLDMEMWTWSDQSLKDQTWTNRQDRRRAFKAGEMTEPDFKAMPTLEYYTTALVVWMATIEHAAGGNAAVVRDRYGADLQAHIDFLSKRPGWKELGGEPQSLPEHIMDGVRGGYEPEKYPKQGVCHIWQYIRDDMRRNVEFADQTITYTAVSNNELCNVPASRRNSAPQIERDREREYGLEVMANLATLLTSLKDKGTVRGAVTTSQSSTPSQPSAPTEPFTGRHKAVLEDVGFNPSIKPDKANVLYTVSSDGVLTWQQHLIAGLPEPSPTPSSSGSGGSSGYIVVDGKIVKAPATPAATPKPVRITGRARQPTHGWKPTQQVGTGWAGDLKDIIPGGQQAIYALGNDGSLRWYWHSGAFNGTAEWLGPKPVSSGWEVYSRVIPMDNGVIYGIRPDGVLRWHKHSNYRNGESGGWSSMDVSWGFNSFKTVFSGGQGVIYVVTNDGKLFWYRHLMYLNPLPMPAQPQLDIPYDAQRSAWKQSWIGPLEVGTGWGACDKLFSPGEGHVYCISPNGDLTWFHHTGWQKGSSEWSTRAGGVKIGSGWNNFVFAFARTVGGDERPDPK